MNKIHLKSCKTKLFTSKNETFGVHDELSGAYSREGVIFSNPVPRGGVNGACAHYIMVSKFQWKPFWLATQRDPQNDWTATQNRVNYDVFAQAPSRWGVIEGELFKEIRKVLFHHFQTHSCIHPQDTCTHTHKIHGCMKSYYERKRNKYLTVFLQSCWNICKVWSNNCVFRKKKRKANKKLCRRKAKHVGVKR